jgi:hypothetical protein
MKTPFVRVPWQIAPVVALLSSLVVSTLPASENVPHAPFAQWAGFQTDEKTALPG